ncbi:MAG: CheR family methyltransferase [Xenococcaceae cyanobacterium]
MRDFSLSQEDKKEIFKRFVELGALTLSVEEFVEILFPNLVSEIEAELQTIAKMFSLTDIWVKIKDLIENSELDHPLILALHRNQLLRNLIGPEYSFINRYPEVYEKLFQEIFPLRVTEAKNCHKLPHQSQHLSIGLIGASYGQELITILKYLKRYLYNPEEFQGFTLTIDVLSKPSTIFERLKQNTMLYSRAAISKYLSPEEIDVWFMDVNAEYLCYSDFLFDRVRFLALDLLDKQNSYLFEEKKYDLILLHNVIQYLEPDEEENLGYVCQFLDQILKEGGTISIINESRIDNSNIIHPFQELYQLSGLYSQQQLHSAFLYNKIQ